MNFITLAPRLQDKPLADALILWVSDWDTLTIARRLKVDEASIYNSLVGLGKRKAAA